jgi:hypothetical protein
MDLNFFCHDSSNLDFWTTFTIKLDENFIVTIIFSKNFCFLHFHIHNFVFWELGCKRNISMQLFLRVKIDLRHISVQEDGEPGNGVSCKWIQCKFLLKIMVTIKFSSNLMVKVVQKSQNGWLLSNRRYTLSNNFLLLSDMYIFQKFKIRSSVKRRTIFVIILLHR